MKRIKFRRIPIQASVRSGLIALLIILIAILAGSSYMAFQEAESVEKKYTIVSYTQSGNFNYIVHLKNNSLYDKEILYPGEGVIFEKITDHINATFSYKLNCSKKVNVQGDYTIIEKICSDLWEKEFELKPKTTFSSSGKIIGFDVKFPINYTHFEEFVNKIDRETGVLAKNPRLIITCKVNVFAESEDGIRINEHFSPSWNVTINNGIINIAGDLHPSREGSIEGKEMIYQPSVVENRNTLLAATITLLIISISFTSVTRGTGIVRESKVVKQIKKKYGDWIVEVNEIPEGKTISLKSIEDLAKVSEDLGRPILYKPASSPNEKYRFCVVDGGMRYEYALYSTLEKRKA